MIAAHPCKWILFFACIGHSWPELKPAVIGIFVVLESMMQEQFVKA
jgi:hypothetical protein